VVGDCFIFLCRVSFPLFGFRNKTHSCVDSLSVCDNMCCAFLPDVQKGPRSTVSEPHGVIALYCHRRVNRLRNSGRVLAFSTGREIIIHKSGNVKLLGLSRRLILSVRVAMLFSEEEIAVAKDRHERYFQYANEGKLNFQVVKPGAATSGAV
jgi:hypothetical protein